jgi:N-acetyl-gamma-glutamyl-phosphate reductase common form
MTVSPDATHFTQIDRPTAAILHGAGYVGGELVRLLHAHPMVDLAAVTSRTFAGDPVHAAHSSLRGQVDLAFSHPDDPVYLDADILLVAAEHGRSMHLVPELLDEGFDGCIVDLSADFRLDAEIYAAWYSDTHAAPDWLPSFVYGLPELKAPYPPGTQFVANPGCFATGISLALAPLAQRLQRNTVQQNGPLHAHAMACTGASGSGASPSAATHFPHREGNVRAYNVLGHRHTAEANAVTGDAIDLSFVPVSGPWTRGIWGTVQMTWPDLITADTVAEWYADAYGNAPLIRCSEGGLPEMKPVIGTPFADLGWVVRGHSLVVGFSLDNLLKGAASQAVQNMNHVLGLPETAGLLHSHAHPAAPTIAS